jgi:hypothetical protein
MRIGIDESLGAQEIKTAAELSALLGIAPEELSVTILPPLGVTFADRRMSRAEARGDLFFPQTSASV